MHIRLLFLLCPFIVYTQTFVKTDKIDADANNNFLSISPSERFIINSIGLKSNPNEIQLYLYDRNSGTNNKLSKDTFDIKDVSIDWGIDDNNLYFSDGRAIFYLNVKSEVSVSPLFSVSANESIRISVSRFGKFISGWIYGDSKRKLFYFDIDADDLEIVFEEEVTRWLSDEVIFHPDNSIFFSTKENQVVKFSNGSDKLESFGVTSKSQLVAVNNTYLFVVENENLIAYEIFGRNRYDLIQFPSLKINHLQSLVNNKLLISFNNQVLAFNPNDESADIVYSSTAGGKVVFCSTSLLIEEQNNSGGVSLNIWQSK